MSRSYRVLRLGRYFKSAGRCIGDVVALLELRVTLEELLARTSWIELAGEPVRTTWVRFGVSKLPLAFSRD